MRDLSRRALAEFIGTALLVATVIGSGIMATRLSPEDVGLQLLENSVATGAVLVALILTLQPISASFNPVVTMVDWLLNRPPGAEVGALMLAQIAGACVGAVLANLMFALPAVDVSTKVRAEPATLLAEAVATFGLVLLIFVAIRTGKPERVAYIVGGYIAAAYWFTSSTSFANPAVTIGRTVSDTFAGIAPSSVAPFIVAQFLGALLALGAVLALTPKEDGEAE